MGEHAELSAQAAPPPNAESGPPASEPLNEDGDEAPAPTAATLILRADQQVYEPERQIVTATGNVMVQFGDGQLAAERLWVNLNHRHMRAEGDVFFNRNQQIIEADSATYNLLQGAGTLTDGRGTLQVSTLAEDFSPTFPNDLAASANEIDYRLQEQGSISQVTSPGGLSIATDARQRLVVGEQRDLRRLRFEASQIAFDADGWYGDNVRITNDPFSPPELEFRGTRVELIPLNAEEDELCIDNPRFVFDQGLTIPVLRRCYTLQRGRLPADAFNPLPTNIGIDGRDRGGLFIEREFSVLSSGPLRLTVTPQFYLSRWLNSDLNLVDPANFGVVGRLRGNLGPRTSFNGRLSIPGLDLQNFTERVRANFRAQRLIGTHRLNVEYTYRDRLFNGSLGFQDVQTSAGVLLESPLIPLGNTQINLSYQASGQYVTANTDRLDLLDPGESLGLTSLFRFQGSVDVSRGFLLWQGQPKPSTPTEGLRFSPRPIVPSLVLVAGLRGVATYYTSNDLQESLEARLSLAGELGHLVRDYFDYTQFNIGFSTNVIGGDTSPFLFDRVVDRNVLTGGILQQIYGPILAGFQTSINVENGREIDTNFILEYRRRTYGLLIRYSPVQETGFLGFRLSDFNWTGRTERFDGDGANDAVVVE
ncbi:MAG: DUF3769 domain-containing protein [Leptolyngbyaceae cyanobacterium SM2_5_2]|nr:DUF3769 domain-containing protein [Leptolyngbyaceae cyanobacterium SM2_5_2]